MDLAGVEVTVSFFSFQKRSTCTMILTDHISYCLPSLISSNCKKRAKANISVTASGTLYTDSPMLIHICNYKFFASTVHDAAS